MTPYLIKGSILFIAINTFLYMLQRLLAPIVRFIPPLKQRYDFEARNLSDPQSQAWQHNQVVEWAFHCSSEGEFEQLRPLIQSCLDQAQKIEVIFTSPSVERRVSALVQDYPEQVRILRFSLLLNLWLSNWSRANNLFMCRYDFFPELLLLPVKRRVLAWASLKGKKPGWWNQGVYQQFDLIIASNKEQFERFSEFVPEKKMALYDFRPAQILSRLQAADHENALTQALNLSLPSERIVLGSVWQSDLFLFEELMKAPGRVHFWLAPHALDHTSIEDLKTAWSARYPDCEVLVFGENRPSASAQKVAWIVTEPGRLLELYGQFTLAYVGGGFGRSIHSVLEPVLAGCWSACGPRTHRSTEIDLANELSPKQVKVVADAKEFYLWWTEHSSKESCLKDDNRIRSIHNWVDQSAQVTRRCLAY